MKNCIRIPRLIVPREIENWAVPACDAYAYNRAILERERALRTKPSLFLCVQHEAYQDQLDDDRKREMEVSDYLLFEEDYLKKLDFGMMLVERTGKKGTRKGIVASIDLEAFGTDFSALVRPAYSEYKNLEPWLSSRRGTLCEFPHSVVLYHDKKNKLMRALDKEDIDEVYSTELSPCGDRVRGLFLPVDLSTEVAHALMQFCDPCFSVISGVRAVLAAKAYWEETKAKLTETEKRQHPARFTLVEFVNAFDEALSLTPVHRVLTETDGEAFLDYASRLIPCERKGNVLQIKDWKSAEKTDAVFSAYLKQNGGRVKFYTDGEFEEAVKGEVGVTFPAVEQGDVGAVMKKGYFPYRAVSLKDSDKRYCLEGREISYD